MGQNRDLSRFPNAITVLDNGNVGIGTTSPYAIATGRNVTIEDSTGNDIAFSFGINGTRTGQIYTSSLQFRLSAVTNIPMLFFTNDTERMRIGANGDIGIGTSSPSASLEIAKANSGGIGPYLFLRNNTSTSNNNAVQISFAGNSGGNATAPTAAIRVTENSTAAATMAFYTYDTTATFAERMRITSGGKIVIAGTVAGTALNDSITINTVNSTDYSGIICTTAGTQRGYYGGTSSGLETGVSGSGYYSIWTSGTERMRIFAGGSIAVGTTSAQARFDIVDPSYNQYTLRVQSSAGNIANGWGGIGFSGEGANTKAGIFFVSDGGSYSRGSLVFATNNDFNQNNATPSNERMRITSAGQVLKPSNPAFRAYYSVNSNWNLAANSTFIFNATEYNIGSCYNTSNGRFTAPVAGVYQFNFYSIYYGAYTNGFVKFAKNGASMTSGTHIHYTTTASAAWNNVNFVTSVYLNSGDYVSLENRDFAVTYHGKDWSSFSGYLVG
jgi:hypothetical protein